MSNISKLAIHFVGNQSDNDQIILSNELVDVETDNLGDILENYFLNNFKSDAQYHFYHETNVALNEIYSYALSIFANSTDFIDSSKNIAKHLYQASKHPKILSGELFVVYFESLVINGIETDAVGIFKTEHYEQFLKTSPNGNSFDVTTLEGIHLNKVDKGCIIYNVSENDGLIVKVVDVSNKNTDAVYWMDEFLKIKQNSDQYFQTEQTMSMYKDFVFNQLPQEYEITKADQVDFLNRSMQFFKKNDNFEMEHFKTEVLQHETYFDSFDEFKQTYAEKREFEFQESFDISDTAVKKQNKFYKKIIKLDKNFHIYVHGDKKLIEQGEDDKGKFYKIYFEEEY
jgi:hypothetical protein